MKFVRHGRRRTAWIAIFAVLLAALAPGLARALAPLQQAQPWTEICSVAGTPAAPGALPASGAEQHHDKIFKHCPFCINQVGHFALPATPPDLALAIDDEIEARDYYRTAAGHAGNTGTRRMLEALASSSPPCPGSRTTFFLRSFPDAWYPGNGKAQA